MSRQSLPLTRRDWLRLAGSGGATLEFWLAERAGKRGRGWAGSSLLYPIVDERRATGSTP